MSKILITAVIASVAGIAEAASFQANFTGQSNSVNVGRGSNSAGYLNLQYVGAPASTVGQFANASFQTFCIDVQSVNSNAGSNPYTWTIESISEAPTPGTNYGVAIELRVKEIIAAAIGEGWINADLSNNGSSDTRIAAIQALIWNNIPAFGYVAPTANIAADYATLENFANGAYAGSNVSGLRAITTNGQDMLYIVPLPPAAIAGLATLVGVAGVARLRRR